jgi:hypothetical protein
MKKHFIIPVFIITLQILFAQSLSAAWGTMDVDRAVKRLADTLVKNGDMTTLEEPAIFISPNDLYDATTGLSLPFASLLREKLVTAFTNRGIYVLLPGAELGKPLFLQGTWQKQGEDLSISLKVIFLGDDGPNAIAAATEKVPLTEIDQQYLTPNRESWARFLVNNLEKNARMPSKTTLHIRPFSFSGKKQGAAQLGGYLAGWLRPALAESKSFQPIDQTRKLKDLPTDVIRMRGMRGTKVSGLPGSNNQTSLTADLLQADAELSGETWLHGDTVEIRTKIIWKDGTQLTAASAEVPASYFPAELLKPPPEPAYKLPDSGNSLNSGTGISVNGLRVELTTTGGEDRPTYHKDEFIKFVMRLNRPAFVYLFDLDPMGNVTLLYPIDSRGNLANTGECGSAQKPNRPIILPEDGCSYNLVASEPYGTDMVWAVAAETPLKLPTVFKDEWVQSENLVSNIRSQGMNMIDGYSESRLELMTEP